MSEVRNHAGITGQFARLSTADYVLLDGLLDHYVGGLINMAKHPDVTEEGKRQYRLSIAQAERIRLALEAWELAQ